LHPSTMKVVLTQGGNSSREKHKVPNQAYRNP
jgi:hypothetical protein